MRTERSARPPKWWAERGQHLIRPELREGGEGEGEGGLQRGMEMGRVREAAQQARSQHASAKCQHGTPLPFRALLTKVLLQSRV
eukprot:scaffold46069_cov31-Tisochrysis_lutea.AAC.1